MFFRHLRVWMRRRREVRGRLLVFEGWNGGGLSAERTNRILWASAAMSVHNLSVKTSKISLRLSSAACTNVGSIDMH